MSAGDIFSQTFVYIVNGVPCANVFYNKAIDDDPGDDDEESAFLSWESNVLPTLALAMSDEVVFECILSRKVVPTTEPSRVFLLSGAGLEPGPSLPANVAWVHRNYTALGSPNHRGRWFFAGLNEGSVLKGTIRESKRDLYENLTAVVTAPLTGPSHTHRLQMYSRRFDFYNDLEAGSVGPVPTKVRNRTPGICSIS